MSQILLPSTLGRAVIKDWKFFPHIQLLQRAVLDTITSPTKNRLIVVMPVQHGKSLYCSYLLPLWHLLAFPDRKIILATYSDTYSGRWGQKIMDGIRDYGPQLTGASLHPDVRSKNLFQLHRREGQLRAVGAGGSVSGIPGHLIVADDLMKDQEEANSPLRRDKLAVWFQSELMTRLQRNGKVVVVMSRRHPDDLTGRLLAANANASPEERWHSIRMPALSEDEVALCPELHPVQELLGRKRDNEAAGTTHIWECLYQQNPIGDPASMEWPPAYWEGIMYDELPPLEPRLRILTLDPSKGSDSKTGDFSAILDLTLDKQNTVWATDGFIRVRPITEVVDTMIEFLKRNTYDGVIIETNGFQEVIAREIISKCQAQCIPCPIYACQNSGNKIARIRASLSPLLAQKRIRIYAGNPHLRILLSQLQQFPSGAHDDAPDSLEMGMQLFNHILFGQPIGTPIKHVV